MKPTLLHKLAFGLAVLAFAAALLLVSQGRKADTGPCLITGLIALAVAARGLQATKGFSYTICIFTAVTASMFHPECFKTGGGLTGLLGPFDGMFKSEYFKNWNSYELKNLITPLLQIIMFGMGSQMSFADFTGVIKMPKGVIIGVIAHYMIMPLVAFGIANLSSILRPVFGSGIADLFDFEPEIKAGIILIGCVPSGLASNVMSFIAGANLALAVTIGAISTLLSPLVTPLLMKLLGGNFIKVDVWSMMLDIINMIILPIVAGFIFNLFISDRETARTKLAQLAGFMAVLLVASLVYVKAKHAGAADFAGAFVKSVGWFFILPIIGALVLRFVVRAGKQGLEQGLSLLSMVGIAAIITIITANGRDKLLNVGAVLLLTSLLHNVAGYVLGYGVSWAAGMPERDRRTVAFEVGMQNGGLASGLAVSMGKPAVGLAPAIFGPLMNVTGSILASWWRGRPVKVENEVPAVAPAAEIIKN